MITWILIGRHSGQLWAVIHHKEFLHPAITTWMQIEISDTLAATHGEQSVATNSQFDTDHSSVIMPVLIPSYGEAILRARGLESSSLHKTGCVPFARSYYSGCGTVCIRLNELVGCILNCCVNFTTEWQPHRDHQLVRQRQGWVAPISGNRSITTFWVSAWKWIFPKLQCNTWYA